VHHTKLEYVHRCKVGDELLYGILGASESLSPFSFHNGISCVAAKVDRLATKVISKNNSSVVASSYLINRGSLFFSTGLSIQGSWETSDLFMHPVSMGMVLWRS
jgi:hypothetical protein